METKRVEKMEQALAAALYTLNQIAVDGGLVDGCNDEEVDVDRCCQLCRDVGCIEWRRGLIISALAPKAIEDFGYEDVTKAEAE